MDFIHRFGIIFSILFFLFGWITSVVWLLVDKERAILAFLSFVGGTALIFTIATGAHF